MSFGWSAGDVFAAANCLRTIIEALNDSTGSSKDYVDLMLELDALQRTLVQVETIFKTHENRAVPSQFPQSTINALGYTVSRCRTLLEEFLFKIRHYQGRLAPGNKGWRQSWRKIGWGLLVGDEVDKVRKALGTHTRCLILLVETMSCLCVQEVRMEQRELVTSRDASQNLCREVYWGVRCIEASVHRISRRLISLEYYEKPVRIICDDLLVIQLPRRVFVCYQVFEPYLDDVSPRLNEESVNESWIFHKHNTPPGMRHTPRHVEIRGSRETARQVLRICAHFADTNAWSFFEDCIAKCIKAGGKPMTMDFVYNPYKGENVLDYTGRVTERGVLQNSL